MVGGLWGGSSAPNSQIAYEVGPQLHLQLDSGKSEPLRHVSRAVVSKGWSSGLLGRWRCCVTRRPPPGPGEGGWQAVWTGGPGHVLKVELTELDAG